VIIRQADTIVGIVYTKERIFKGFLTGIIFADSTLNSMVIAEPVFREMVLRRGLQALIDRPGVRALRILTPQCGYEYSALSGIASLALSRTPVTHHSVLRLPGNYELFLQGLGSRTRRNFRYYRRLNGAGRTFVADLPFSDFKEAAFQLLAEGGIGVSPKGVSRALNVLSAAERPLLVGLKDASGRYVSILGGWYETGRAIVFFQMNSDRKYPDASLSLVLRGHFLEMAIERGIHSVVFWAGVGGALERYVEQVPTVAMYLDKTTVLWQWLRRIIRSRRSVLPVRFRDLAEWIVSSTAEAR
jgi:hypothetical protein